MGGGTALALQRELRPVLAAEGLAAGVGPHCGEVILPRMGENYERCG
ncbi:MAG: hypothetical protein ISS49_16055 [Anaerolineae bacterium]|nr:hypothetical protein [Anaerolineae bacterium]